MRLVVFGTHQYQWHMPLFGMMHEKYWPGQKITYFCDKQIMELPANIEVRKVAGVEGDWDWEVNFIDGVRGSLATLDDPVVMITLADMWPIRPVNQEMMMCLERYLNHTITTNRKVIRMSVGQEIGHTWQGTLASDPTTADIHTVDEWEGLVIRSCSPTNIHMGLCGGFLLWPSLWNRELLVKTIIGKTWHDFEPDNTMNLIGTEIISTWVLPSSINGKWWPIKDIDPTLTDDYGSYIYRYSHVTSRDNRNYFMIGNGFFEADKDFIKSKAPGGVGFIE